MEKVSAEQLGIAQDTALQDAIARWEDTGSGDYRRRTDQAELCEYPLQAQQFGRGGRDSAAPADGHATAAEVIRRAIPLRCACQFWRI